MAKTLREALLSYELTPLMIPRPQCKGLEFIPTRGRQGFYQVCELCLVALTGRLLEYSKRWTKIRHLNQADGREAADVARILVGAHRCRLSDRRRRHDAHRLQRKRAAAAAAATDSRGAQKAMRSRHRRGADTRLRERRRGRAADARRLRTRLHHPDRSAAAAIVSHQATGNPTLSVRLLACTFSRPTLLDSHSNKRFFWFECERAARKPTARSTIVYSQSTKSKNTTSRGKKC